MTLDIIRDSLGDELTSDTLAVRELALDKSLIQLIQHSCKTDRLARALDLTRMLHLTPSFDAAIKIAGFYHLLGLQEKMEMLKDERAENDRLEDLRDRRHQIASDFAPVPAMRLPLAGHATTNAKPKPFSDFQPPPALHRPGLERATPAPGVSSHTPAQSQVTEDSTVFGTSVADSTQDYDFSWSSSPGEKRKRPAEDEPVRETRSPGLDAGAKRRAISTESASAARMPPPQAREYTLSRGSHRIDTNTD